MRPSVWNLGDRATIRPGHVENSFRERLARTFFLLVHDFIAHPLIGVSGGARWAYRFHDRCTGRFEGQTAGYDRDQAYFEGPDAIVEPIFDVLDSSSLRERFDFVAHRDGTHFRFNVIDKTAKRRGQ